MVLPLTWVKQHNWVVVLSTRVSYTTQLSGSTFHSGESYNTTEWWYFHSRELYNTTELTHELSDVWIVCIFIKLHITAQSGPVIRVILSHSHWSPQGGINDTCYENLWSNATKGTHSLYVCMVKHIARVWINRVRLPILLVVSRIGKTNISLSAFMRGAECFCLGPTITIGGVGWLTLLLFGTDGCGLQEPRI